RLRATSNLTSSTAHGGCNPSALVNSASTPTPIETLPAAAAPGTCGQAQMQPAHMPTGLDYDDQQFSLLDSTRNDEGPRGMGHPPLPGQRPARAGAPAVQHARCGHPCGVP